MNYSNPVTKTKEEESKDIELIKENLEKILDEQIIISQLAKGITFEDTNNMDAYERGYIVRKLIQMKKDENEAKQKAIESMKK